MEICAVNGRVRLVNGAKLLFNGDSAWLSNGKYTSNGESI